MTQATDAGAQSGAGSGSIDEPRDRIRALIAAHSPEAPAALTAAAADSRPLLRAFAAYEIGATHHPDAMGLLTQLSRDASPAVRGATVEGLGVFGGDRARSLILAFAVDDADVGVKAEAISALKSLGGADAEQALQKLSNDPSPSVRNAATEALRTLRPPAP